MPAFLVGGYLRDALRNVPTRDIDIAVQGNARSLAEGLGNLFGGSVVPLGRANGVPPSGAQAPRVCRVVVPSAEDGKWTVDLAEIGDGIQEDLPRRDFSVDAMALAVDDWATPGWESRLLDPFGGRRDLEGRTIRAIGPSIFQDDPVRLLRAVRLAATLGFRIESATAGLISQQAHLISSTAAERVRDEFLGLLSLDGANNHLELLDRLRLLCCIIPELGITKGVEQPKEHYWDVFGHSIHTVEAVERITTRANRDLVSLIVPWTEDTEEHFSQEVCDGHTRRTVLKLGGLLHDIAKPQSKMVDAGGRTRFLGHHTLGASMCGDMLGRLRLSNRGVEMIHGMVENHLRPLQMSHGADLPTPRAVYRYFRDVGDVAVDTLYLSLGDHLAARGPELDMGGWYRHIKIVAHVLEVGTQEQGPVRMPRLITGHDLMGELKLSPGPLIGDLLEGVRDAQAAGEVDTLKDALDWARRRLRAMETASPSATSGGA